MGRVPLYIAGLGTCLVHFVGLLMCLVLELGSINSSCSFAMLRLRWMYEELKLVTVYVLGLYRD